MRYFSERRVPVTFVDLARKPIAIAELRRFADRFGALKLIDTESARYRDLGLGYISMDDDDAFDRLLRDQRLLRLPLVRAGDELSVGWPLRMGADASPS